MNNTELKKAYENGNTEIVARFVVKEPLQHAWAKWSVGDYIYDHQTVNSYKVDTQTLLHDVREGTIELYDYIYLPHDSRDDYIDGDEEDILETLQDMAKDIYESIKDDETQFMDERGIFLLLKDSYTNSVKTSYYPSYRVINKCFAKWSCLPKGYTIREQEMIDYVVITNEIIQELLKEGKIERDPILPYIEGIDQSEIPEDEWDEFSADVEDAIEYIDTMEDLSYDEKLEQVLSQFVKV